MDSTNSPTSTIKSPPKTIAKREWPLGKLNVLGAEPAIKKSSGRARPTASFNRNPAKTGGAANQHYQCVDASAAYGKVQNEPGHQDHRSRPSAEAGHSEGRSIQPARLIVLEPLQRSPITREGRESPCQQKNATVTKKAAVRQHHFKETLCIIALYIIHYAAGDTSDFLLPQVQFIMTVS